MELNQEKLEKLVVEAAIEQLFETNLHSLVSKKVDEEVTKRIDAMFTSQVNDQIKNAIDDAINDGFHRQYNLVDSWGKKLGETTLAKELENKVSNYWTQKVDSRGEATSSYNAKWTRAEYLMTQIMERNFAEYSKQLIANAAGPFKDQLRTALHQSINEQLGSIFNVISKDDKELKNTGKSTLTDPGV